MALSDLINPFHIYVFSTSFWYFLRGIVRVIDPATVCGWFRPPSQGFVDPNDLELYTTRTDAYCLLALSFILLIISDAVPLPSSYTTSALVPPPSDTTRPKSPYARAIIFVTLLHHAATCAGAYTHWVKPTHWTVAMSIGVWGNLALIAVGIVALRSDFDGKRDVVAAGRKVGKTA
ncbi:uncharacterized protein MYCGRDRAFT_109129 [Zymoseptoria tritici IPO323]|uniref:Uncharacterized protein n=1 Tax=Zymoseptoria tritici (strain CBS 115943 / IPO323) TaxID=336722 RepID=F9X8E0_ZYMTI|nr:uncharacterized protein MYCGRDRAFT_109129 [Zymoseptoria tritici IPO323]EGP88381.1 hypothetical protein MYCGRDRAFT_109129 [Zymoseptoria tritici IPO323]